MKHRKCSRGVLSKVQPVIKKRKPMWTFMQLPVQRGCDDSSLTIPTHPYHRTNVSPAHLGVMGVGPRGFVERRQSTEPRFAQGPRAGPSFPNTRGQPPAAQEGRGQPPRRTLLNIRGGPLPLSPQHLLDIEGRRDL